VFRQGRIDQRGGLRAHGVGHRGQAVLDLRLVQVGLFADLFHRGGLELHAPAQRTGPLAQLGQLDRHRRLAEQDLPGQPDDEQHGHDHAQEDHQRQQHARDAIVARHAELIGVGPGG